MKREEERSQLKSQKRCRRRARLVDKQYSLSYNKKLERNYVKPR